MTEKQSQAAIRKQVAPLVRPDFPYRCSLFELPTNIRLFQIPAGFTPRLSHCSSEREREREVSTAVSVFVGGYMCVCAHSDG